PMLRIPHRSTLFPYTTLFRSLGSLPGDSSTHPLSLSTPRLIPESLLLRWTTLERIDSGAVSSPPGPVRSPIPTVGSPTPRRMTRIPQPYPQPLPRSHSGCSATRRSAPTPADPIDQHSPADRTRGFSPRRSFFGRYTRIHISPSSSLYVRSWC